MVEAATEFRKSGFNDEDAANLALVATTYQNVADDAISAGEASNFIIAQMKAFGIEAENASHIIDALNEVSNRFAVSSSDLSNNIGKASAALATGNTTYEETLGLFTGITEITRNASRAARGLVSIQSRLTQVLDAESSTGKALIDIYNDLGIELFDSTGQIRSLYDILTDLSKQWDGLSTNQKDYIALTQAGSNQTQNFLALMSNFETVTSATSTALNSTGSAMEENTRYMESLEAKTNQLKATFQDLSNNVIENELVKVLLDLANTVLKGLNNEVGQTIIQFGLLTGVLTGGLTIWGTVTKNLAGVANVTKTLIPLLTGTAGGLGAIASAALPLAAILAGVGVAGWAVYKALDKANPTLEETAQLLSDSSAQFQANQERLKEINNMSWHERTPEILAEKQALERENEELVRQIELYKARKKELIDKKLSSGFSLSDFSGVEYRAYDRTGKDTTGFVISEDQIKRYREYGYTIERVAKTAAYAGAELKTKLTENVNILTQAMADGSIENLEFADVVYNDTVAALEELSLYSSDYKILLDKLNSATNEYKRSEELAATSIRLTKDEYEEVIKVQPKLKDNIEELNGLYYLNKDALQQLIITSDQYKNGRIRDEVDVTLATIENSKLRIQALEAELVVLEELGRTADDNKLAQIEKLYGIKTNKISQTQSVIQNAYDRLMALSKGLTYTPDALPTSPKNPKGKDPYLQSLKDGVDSLKFELELLEAKGAPIEDQVAKMRQIQDALHQQAEYMRSTKASQTDINKLSREWWEYEKKITSEKKDQTKAIDLLKSELELLKAQGAPIEDRVAKMRQIQDALHQQAEYMRSTKASQTDINKLSKEWWDYEKKITGEKEDQAEAYKQILASLEKEISGLETSLALYDEVLNEYVDKNVEALEAQKKALQEQNDELDKQIEKERALDALARARQTQVLVYKDGRYQYVQDADAVSEAQSALEDIRRNERVEAEIKLIDEQIEKWEDYRNEWGKVVKDYSKGQDALIEKQKLGTKLEADTWSERLNNLKAYKVEYQGLMEQLAEAQVQQQLVQQQQQASGGSTSTSTSPDWSALWWEAENNPNLSASEKEALQDYYHEQKAAEMEGTGKKFHSDSGKWYAKGTTSAVGGLSLVGEQGPELRVLGHGDGIIPADITKNLWAWGATTPASMMAAISGGLLKNSNMSVTIQNLNLPSVKNGNDFVQYMKNNFWRQTVQFTTA